MTEVVISTDFAGKSKLTCIGWTALSHAYRRMLRMHEVATSKNWHLLRMHEAVICTSVEHDWGGHNGCNLERMFVGGIWSASWGMQETAECQFGDYVR